MKLFPDPADRESLVSLLLLGEILTRRGENGPLRRIWSLPVRRRTPNPPHRQTPSEARPSGKTE